LVACARGRIKLFRRHFVVQILARSVSKNNTAATLPLREGLLSTFRAPVQAM
jgi:hypothetical protein